MNGLSLHSICISIETYYYSRITPSTRGIRLLPSFFCLTDVDRKYAGIWCIVWAVPLSRKMQIVVKALAARYYLLI